MISLISLYNLGWLTAMASAIPPIAGNGTVVQYEPAPDPEIISQMQEELARLENMNSSDEPARLKARRRESHAEMESIRVNTFIHVVGDTSEQVNGVSDETVNRQVKVLNEAFGTAGFIFNLTETIRTANATLSKDATAMKSALRRGDNAALNLYYIDQVVSKEGRGLLGLATFPVELRRQPKLDGVLVTKSTLPINENPEEAGSFDQGKTSVHEVGHWMGLLHPSEGGCAGANDDMIVDTPREDRPAQSCNRPIDTCPDQPGQDSIHNYMALAEDYCLTEFTPGQMDRMRKLWKAFRSGNSGTRDLKGCSATVALLTSKGITPEFAQKFQQDPKNTNRKALADLAQQVVIAANRGDQQGAKAALQEHCEESMNSEKFGTWAPDDS